ncbi:unnamed protein product [Prunus armeniaca]
MGDIPVKALVFDSEACEGIGKEYVDRTSSVDEDSAYVKIGNVGPNNHGIGVGKNNALLLFLVEGYGFPPLIMLICQLRPLVKLRICRRRPVFRINYWCTAADHVDQPIAQLLEGRMCI